MKNLVFNLLVQFIFFINITNAQCIPNPEFSEYCGTTILKNNSPTFSDNCLTGWMPSHGTPQVFWYNYDVTNPNNTPIKKPYWNFVYMWAYGEEGRSRGEGILAPFVFKKYQTYNVTMRYMISLKYPASPTDVEIRLVAAQDIRRPSEWKFGNLVPPATSQQRISTVPGAGNTGAWKFTSLVFTADDNYNQFWVYPHTTIYNQAEVYVDYVTVCKEECENIMYYKEGLLSAGEPRSGIINIGSSFGGSTDVTISPTSQTEIIAAKEVIFKPEFKATVTTGAFVAKINPCSTTPAYTRPGQSADTSILNLPVEDNSNQTGGSTYEEEYGESYTASRSSSPTFKTKAIEVVEPGLSFKEGVIVYPNPAQDNLRLEIYSKRGGIAKISLFNSVGALVKQFQLPVNQNEKMNFDLDIRACNRGLYLVQVIDPTNKNYSRKIEKLR